MKAKPELLLALGVKGFISRLLHPGVLGKFAGVEPQVTLYTLMPARV